MHANTDLVLFEPFLKQLFSTLLQNRAGKFKRLKMIKLSLLQEDTEVLQDG
jgi:hypothetical protein